MGVGETVAPQEVRAVQVEIYKDESPFFKTCRDLSWPGSFPIRAMACIETARFIPANWNGRLPRLPPQRVDKGKRPLVGKRIVKGKKAAVDKAMGEVVGRVQVIDLTDD